MILSGRAWQWLFLGCSSLLANGLTQAAPPHRLASLSLGVEDFRWQEFDDRGQRLLVEQGPRAVARLDIDAPSRRSWMFWGLHLKAYTGIVDYNGQDNNSVFVASDTNYRGGSGEAEFGVQNRLSAGRRVGVLAAIGIEAWRRDIADSKNSLGDPVAGFREDYRTGLGRVGLTYGYSGRRYAAEIRLGVSRPFRVDEDIMLYGEQLRIHPRPRWSGYLGWRIESGHRQFTLRYDSRRFGASDALTVWNPVLARYESVWQPRSHADAFEISFGYRF